MGLAQEALALVLVPRGVEQDLQGHGAAQLLVLGAVDDAHAALAQPGQDAVVADDRPDENVARGAPAEAGLTSIVRACGETVLSSSGVTEIRVKDLTGGARATGRHGR